MGCPEYRPNLARALLPGRILNDRSMGSGLVDLGSCLQSSLYAIGWCGLKQSATQDSAEKLSGFHIVILILSIYVLSALFAQKLLYLTPEMHRLLDGIDALICLVFIYDFFARLYYAPDRRTFVKWNWIDLISSIPMVDVLRWGRIPRVIRIVRLLRAFRSVKVLMSYLFKNRAKGTVFTLNTIAIILIIFSSIAILNFEIEPHSNIRTAEDALWWSFVTLATIGYGDKYPVTLEGKLVAVFLITTGVGVFSTLTAYIATLFFAPEQQKETEAIDKLAKEIESLRKEINSLKNQYDL